MSTMRLAGVFSLMLCAGLACGRSWGGEVSADEKNAAAIQQLKTKLERAVTVEMPDVTVARALELLARRAETGLLLVGREDRPAYQKRVNFTLDNARAVDILDVLCDLAGLQYELRPGTVRVSSVLDQRERRVVFAAYAVDDLLIHLPDFPPVPDMLATSFYRDSSPPGAAANPFSAQAVPTLTSISQMIHDRVRPESWDPALGTSIEERGKLLVVMQTEEVHALIRRLLAGFRARFGRQVGLEVRALNVKSTDVDRLRQEARARGTNLPELDPAALDSLEKLVQDGAATQVFNGSTVIYNTQMGLLQDLHAQRALCEYNIVGDNSFEPVTRIVHTGTVVLAIPVLSDDDQLVNLTLRMARVESPGATETFVIQRGGLVAGTSTGGGGNIITIKRRKGEGKDQKEEDVTSEFDITQQGTGGAYPAIGPLQLQLPAVSRMRLEQDVTIKAGKTAIFSTPLCQKDGLAPGRELAWLVRCNPLIAAAVPMEPEKKDIAELPAGLKQLLEKPVTLNFLETPFQRAIEAFGAQAKLPVVIDTEGLGNRLHTPVTMDVKDMKAGEALDTLLRSGNAAIVPYTSLVWVTSRQKVSARRMTLRVFDIRDLTQSHEDYPGLLRPEELEAGQVSNPFGVVAAPDMANSGLRGADIAAVIHDKLLPEEFADPASSLEESASHLVEVNTPEAIQRTEQMLAQLRKTARRPINLSARWAVVSAAALANALGAQLPAVLDEAGTGKVRNLLAQPATRDLAAARIVCFNGQRASAFGMVERAFVSSYQMSGSVYDPTILSVWGGANLDVKPLIMEGTGGKESPTQLMLETRLLFSRTDTSPATVDPLAPRKDEKEPPALTMPATPGKIQTPTDDSLEIKCMVRVPDGGAALFRLPVPAWLEGENQDEVRKGLRTLIVLLEAQQQNE